MGRNLDYNTARQLLEGQFSMAEEDYRLNRPATVPENIAPSVAMLSQSRTQAFREALIGCCIARILDSEVGIRFPYMGQDDNAYNDRTMDETVINPFLCERLIPCYKGMFLSVFRRNVGFVEETRAGLRDKEAFSTMLGIIDRLRGDPVDLATATVRLSLYRFVELRDQSRIDLPRIRRLSMEQQRRLLHKLLSTPSGGFLSVLMTVAAFLAVSDAYGLSWDVEWQGINVPDAAKGAAGDISISDKGEFVFSVEVTERPVDHNRVRSTFITKMSLNNVEEYLFLLSGSEAGDAAKKTARSYFPQGHEINFVSLDRWGAAGRAHFTENAAKLLDGPDIPASIKVAWNDCVRGVV